MAAETTSEVHHEGGGHGVFPPFDPTHYPSQIFWFVIAFAILYALMSRVALPRVGEIKTMRRDKIASELDEAQKLQAQADAAASSRPDRQRATPSAMIATTNAAMTTPPTSGRCAWAQSTA